MNDQQLAKIDEARPPATTDRFAATITMVREAMLNPDVDANKARVMADVLTSLEDRAMAAEFNRDFNAALFDMPIITKGGIITIPAKDGKPERTQGRFAKFEDIDRVVRPILRRHNLAIRFEVGDAGGAIMVRPILSHANGHTERGEAMRLPLDTSGAKNNVQGAGSATSYGKRYTMCALLNIITEGTDDDGSLGKFAIDMPHEREIAVLEQAEEAAAAGNYQAWYDQQGTKDRAWLVSSSHHARLGGTAVAALPGAAVPRTQRSDPPQTREPAQRQQQRGKHDTTTAEGWTAQYVDDCAAAASIAELDEIKRKGSNALGKLSDSHVKLWEKADAAEGEARDRLQQE